MGSTSRRRRFGKVRKLPSGRFQASYLGPDGQRRYAPHTFERKGDADRFLSLTETQMNRQEWTDPERASVRLEEYAERWIQERPNLRPRTVDLYTWLLKKHIAPHIGRVPLGKLTPALVREWRSRLLNELGVSASQTAKSYRLLRAVLMTAVEDDGILPRNPCRIKGAGDEKAPERPVLTVAQVFELAERVGKRPVGSVRKHADGTFGLRYARNGEMRSGIPAFATRAAAAAALWRLADKGEADCRHDRRFRAMVLLSAFASLRYGEVIALRRRDLNLDAGTVEVREAYTQRPSGELLLGPPKSEAGKRVVGIPDAILAPLREHVRTYVSPGSDALVFPAPMGGPMRRSGFNKLTAWPHVVKAIDAEGLHFHDLRHTGNTFASDSGAGLRDLMARMGHDSERAAMIYQHKSRGADNRITTSIDEHVRREIEHRERDDDEGDEGPAGVPAPVA
ncbi:MAG: tyrosine-type recombinase/integrase [Streptosporangiales bacterium]|nr:tyrosine-type recombinase/integrase [Streptosporangiales bacterium]